MSLWGLLAVSQQGWAGEQDSRRQVVGHIASVECANPNGFVHIRNKETVRKESRLMDGDTLTITDPSCKVTVRLGNKDQILTSSDGTFEIKLVNLNQGTLRERLLHLMGFGSKSTSTQSATNQGVDLGLTRSDGDGAKVSIPLLQMWDNKIAFGTRSLNLAWRDGVAPFEVTVTVNGMDKPPLVHNGNIHAHSTRLEGIRIEQGTYAVAITDNHGSVAKAEFEAVDPSTFPKVPSELIGRPDSDLLAAGWLASIGHGEYVFEAYQQIHTLKEKDQQTARVLEWLEAGWRPRLK